jgi:hypothetical protein
MSFEELWMRAKKEKKVGVELYKSYSKDIITSIA